MINHRLPNLIVIGAMKCGTTSLHNYLNKHPDIFMSQSKELDFFIEEGNWNRDIQWYKEQFQSKLSICGESSQNYSKRHHFKAGVAERIYKTIPDVHIIYIVRDPIQRIISHYHEALEGGYAPQESLNEYLTNNIENNHYILTSSYYYQISAYLEYFPQHKIHIISLDELQNSRLESMNKIFRFLNLCECNSDSLFDFTKNTFNTKRSKNFLGSFLYSRSSIHLRNIMPRKLKDMIKGSNFTTQLTTTPVKREDISEDTISLLISQLKEDINLFRKFTGNQFKSWLV